MPSSAGHEVVIAWLRWALQGKGSAWLRYVQRRYDSFAGGSALTIAAFGIATDRKCSN